MKMLIARIFITAAIILLTGICSAQGLLKGTVLNEEGEPVPFCAVAVKGSSYGCLANEDGVFTIFSKTGDVLVFYSLGYETREIHSNEISPGGVVRLRTSVKTLAEVTVLADDERLYDMLLACRRKLIKSSKQNSKAYFQVQTKKDGEPVELLEAYYNAETAGKGVSKLNLKNGRVGLVEFDNRYFVSFSTTRAISMLKLTEDAEYIPGMPLQYGKRGMKKGFLLKQIDEDAQSYHIAFEPRKGKRRNFSGDIWIDKKTQGLLKIRMVCEKALRHPFVAYGDDTIKEVSLDITYTFEPENFGLSLINFSYDVKHKSTRRRDSLRAYFDGGPEKLMKTRGLLYFFDAGKPFQLPYYSYNSNYTDYRKISLIPYDTMFWRNAGGLLYTKEQKEALELLERKGSLVNFKRGKFTGRKGLYESNNFEWKDTTRINYTKTPEPDLSQRMPNVAVQIYLDVNEVGDSLQHFSATVFDAMQTYLPGTVGPEEKCMINMCFDVYEIERRKMEAELRRKRRPNKFEIDWAYREAVKRAEQQAKTLRYELAGSGKDEAMKKWNKYCKEQLGFDNMLIFKVQQKEQE